MTLDEALARLAAEFDEAAAQALADLEDILRHRGATDEELEIELSRLRSELAASRRGALETARALAETGNGVQ